MSTHSNYLCPYCATRFETDVRPSRPTSSPNTGQSRCRGLTVSSVSPSTASVTR